MIKRKRLVWIFICFIALMLIITLSSLFPKMKKEVSGIGEYKIKTIRELVSKNGHFYIYLYRNGCSYCENISADIKKLKKENTVYSINVDDVESFKQYDWEKHEKNFDIEIGEKTRDGEMIFYNELDKEMIEKKYPPIDYKIVLANSDYIMLHPNKVINKIYAVSTHPQLGKTELQTDNIPLPGVPMLLEVNEHKIVNYLFDDKEIIHFMKSNKAPKDVYWNIK